MKKFLSIALCLTMLMSLGSVACFAQTGDTTNLNPEFTKCKVCLSGSESEDADALDDFYFPGSEANLKSVGSSLKSDVLDKIIVEGVTTLVKGLCLAVGTLIVRAVLNAFKCDVNL